MTDIIGKWAFAGAAILTDGTTLYEFTSRITIEPAEGEGTVRVISETNGKNSRSVSAPTTPRPMPDGGAILLYDYIADPTHEATANHDFFGMTRFIFAADGESAKGSYLNFNGRYTCGEARLERV